jgi:hypothetical protein
MPKPNITVIDTIVVGVYDSTMVITKESGSSDQVIIIQDQKTIPAKDWYENPLISSLLIPIIVAIATAWVIHLVKRSKYKAEVEKLTEETKQLKKSFEPIVISTLQSIQDKIIDSKIKALNKLVELRLEFISFNQHYDHQGDAIINEESEYHMELYKRYGSKQFDEIKAFHYTYSHLFPDIVLISLNELMSHAKSLEENVINFHHHEDGHIEPGQRDLNEVKEMIEKFEKAITLVRKDCHLDSDRVHKFIESNS